MRSLILSTARLAAGMILLVSSVTGVLATNPPDAWKREWPNTDFSQSRVDLGEILSGGPPKDGIPAIDDPSFVPLADATDLAPDEPVMVFAHGGEAKAYPLRILIWHEIVNDKVGGLPVVVTYCPLCNTGIVFSRELDGRLLDFGVSGKLLHSDMIMYDRQTESWWQQFTGEAIVGELAGKQLTMLTSNVLPFELFAERHPDGVVLVPNDRLARQYGTNPYRYYDTSDRPFLFRGTFDEDIEPLAYVVAVGDQAWPLSVLRKKGEIAAPPLVLRWRGGMTSALDKPTIAAGRDIGFVDVMKTNGETAEPVPFVTTFAFAFRAFHPDGTIHELDKAE